MPSRPRGGPHRPPDRGEFAQTLAAGAPSVKNTVTPVMATGVCARQRVAIGSPLVPSRGLPVSALAAPPEAVRMASAPDGPSAGPGEFSAAAKAEVPVTAPPRRTPPSVRDRSTRLNQRSSGRRFHTRARCCETQARATHTRLRSTGAPLFAPSGATTPGWLPLGNRSHSRRGRRRSLSRADCRPWRAAAPAHPRTASRHPATQGRLTHA